MPGHKKRKVSETSDSPPATPTQASFFGAPLQAQPLQAPSPSPSPSPTQLTVSSQLLLLLAALVEELRTHNALEALKIQLSQKEKQDEKEAAAQAETADQARFAGLQGMYT